MSWGYQWRPYVPVATRRARARRYAAREAKRTGRQLCPVEISGRKITHTFWGQAWCDNLESYSDFANRLPRGRTYVRNGSVIDVQIEEGKVIALVSGSEIYRVKVQIATLGKATWTKIKRDCSQSIDSLMDLLQGRFSQGVMQRLTRQREGLFPQPKEIRLDCSCPDWAILCKHVAAVLYGVGARLDQEPQLLFSLRGVDHTELVHQAVAEGNLDSALDGGRDDSLAGEDLGELFGIDLETSATSSKSAASVRPKPQRKSVRKRPAKKKATKKKVAKKTTGNRELAEKTVVEKTAVKKRTTKKKVAKRTSGKKKPAKKEVARKTAVKKKSAKKKKAVRKRPK